MLENLEALLGSALAGPAPSGLNLELVLDSVFGDQAGNFQALRDSLERNVDYLPALIDGMQTRAADALKAALVDLEAGRIDLAVGQLLTAGVIAVVQAVNLAMIPVDPLLGPLGYEVSYLGADATVALIGPVVNGVGTTAQAIQGIAAALDSGEPDRVLNALAAAPALITDRVLNGGYTSDTRSVIGDQPWPGVLSNGLAGPVAQIIEICQFLQAAATPRSDTLTTVPLRAESERVVTLDVDAGVSPSGGQERHGVEGPNDVQDADEGTNTDVMAADESAVEAPGADGRRPSPFGSNSMSRYGGGAGLNTLRDGIRDRIHGFREGVRDVVRTVTGRGVDHDDSTPGSADESP
jgi:hypothetical protein